MNYNPRTYIQDLQAEAVAIVALLGQGWSTTDERGLIVEHASGAKLLLLTGRAFAAGSKTAVSVTDMSAEEIVNTLREMTA